MTCLSSLLPITDKSCADIVSLGRDTSDLICSIPIHFSSPVSAISHRSERYSLTSTAVSKPHLYQLSREVMCNFEQPTGDRGGQSQHCSFKALRMRRTCNWTTLWMSSYRWISYKETLSNQAEWCERERAGLILYVALCWLTSKYTVLNAVSTTAWNVLLSTCSLDTLLSAELHPYDRIWWQEHVRNARHETGKCFMICLTYDNCPLIKL